MPATGEMLEHLDLDSWHRQLVVNSTQCRCSINMLNETSLELLARVTNSTGECPAGRGWVLRPQANNLDQLVMDRETWRAAVHGVTKSWT